MVRNRTHLLLLLICNVAVLAACTPQSSATPLTPAVSSTALAATPTPPVAVTATPVPATTESDSTATTLKSWLEIAVAALEFATGIIVLLLAVYLIRRLRVEAKKYRFELADLKNGTGVESLDTALGGLQIIVREKLIDKLHQFKKDTETYPYLVSEATKFPEKPPLPEAERANKALEDVISSLGDEAPKNLKPLVSLIHYFLPQQGTRINTTLQHDGDTPGKVGVSFEILDLSASKNPVLITLWQPEVRKREIMPWVILETPNNKAQTGKISEPQPAVHTPAARQPAWSTQVAAALKAASLEEDAIRYYQMSLLQKPPDPGAATALVECQNTLQERAAAAAAFSMAASLEEGGLLDLAITNYSKIFSDQETRDRASRYWTAALKESSKGDAYFQLAKDYASKLNLHKEAVGLYRRAAQEAYAPAIEALEKYYTERAEHLVTASQLLFDNDQWKAASQYVNEVLSALPAHEKAKKLLARLKERQPVDENTEALAAYELGKIYQEQNDLASAKAKFELALEKKPDFADAKTALSVVLQSTSSLRSQFEQFLEGALAWLAVEIYRQECNQLLPEDPKDESKTTRRKNSRTNTKQDRTKANKKASARDLSLAQYHNFFGAHLLSYYGSYPYYFEAAEKEFVEATKLAPEWASPFKSLGDAYSIRAFRIRSADSAFRNLERAISYYDIALQKKELTKEGKLAETPLADPMQSRIQLDRAYANLSRWKETPEDLRKVIKAAERLVRSGKADDSAPLLAEHEQVYSSLAELYALIAYRYEKANNACGCDEPQDAKLWSCFYFGCAGFLNRERITSIVTNPLSLQVFPNERTHQDFATYIKSRQIEKEAFRITSSYTWKDVKDTMEKAGIGCPAELTPKKE